MRNLLYILVLCQLLVGCGGNDEIDRQLAEVERLIEVAPDSAMVIIDDIDANTLSGKKQKAHYALLKSMALDKNYIDTTTFDVLQPGIDYYLDHGTPDEKLRTYYYQGVIFYNQRDRDNALNSLSKGLDILKGCTDSLVIARMYSLRGELYKELYDFDNYIDCNLLAANIYNRLNIPDFGFDRTLNALYGTIFAEDETLGDSILNIIQNFTPLTESQLQALSRAKLSFALNIRSRYQANIIFLNAGLSEHSNISGILYLLHILSDMERKYNVTTRYQEREPQDQQF